MKQVKRISFIAATMLVLAACSKDEKTTPEPETVIATETPSDFESRNGGGGHVYTLSNQTSGNRVMDYKRASDGTLTLLATYASGGNGSGGGLGNQGAVILTDADDDDDNFLLAVNAGSNSISSFKVSENGLTLKSTISSGGMRPVSITQHDGLVFVLNAGGNGNISGFHLSENGLLYAITGSTRPLSSNASGPAQIEFVNDGEVLVITEKATNKIITYRVNENGRPGAMHSITSANPTPFGFAVGKGDNIFVSEAAGGAPGASTLSSYSIRENGSITLRQGPVGAGQSAACWVVVTKNGKYAYTTNTASNNLTTFNVNNNGNISVNTAISATSSTGPIDAALSKNSKFLYVLNGGTRTISAFTVAPDGSLSNVQSVAGLPTGANGLAAR
jgi:6-phosphogluconolactonase